MDSNESPDPPRDDPVNGGSEEEGGDSAGGAGESSLVVPDTPVGDIGVGSLDLDSRVADVAGGDGGPPGTAAAVKEKIRRKRGRAPRASSEKAKSVSNHPPRKREKKDEEDVCFICFDGGELVVCDRRGCPKAYHPACVKRSQSFFRSKARWNCGWHICTSCQKTAHYMCYTCPHSLCKSCYRNADFVCIRETKGLCATCRGTIMLIENVEERNKEMVHVDFDDKTSWEYLFKVYWTDLKAKLSLAVDELTQAKNLRKERKIKSRKTIEKLSTSGCAKLGNGTLGNQRPPYINGSTGWASKELLEFVGYMKGGDVSAMSRFEVQALLLEYVNRNSLRDPKLKWQISCDMRLGKLFGKASVDHFEMLKLLDSHFHVKEDSQIDGIVRGTGFDMVGAQMDIDLNKAEQPVVGVDKLLETCAKLDEKENHIDQDCYSMLDSQRITSMYLRRNSIEDLIADAEEFKRKVVGSIVRIRISGGDQNVHRLVQVTGTSKATELYKVGDRYTSVKLEILNFGRKEVISIDEVSDNDFSEEECRQFSQSFQHGDVKWSSKCELEQKTLSVKAEQVIDESSCQLPMLVKKSILDQGREISGINSWSTGKNHADAISSVTREALSGTGSEISPSPLSTGTEQSVNDDETYKMWLYQDSNGKVHGPFTMVQMRKWRTVGHFSHDQRIWRIDEKQDDAILLTDALEGHFLKEQPALLSREEVRIPSDDRDSSLDGVSSISVNTNNNSARRELGSRSSSHSVKIEGENIEKSCRYYPGQFVGPSGTSSDPISRGQGFDFGKGISSHQPVGAGQIPDCLNGKKGYDGDGYSSTQSSGQNWQAPSPVVSSYNGYPRAGGSLINSLLATPQQSKGIELAFPALPGSAQKPAFENFRSPNVCVDDLGPSRSSAMNRAMNSEWDSNLVTASSQKLTDMCSIGGSTLTLGSAQLMPPPTAPAPFSWQAMVMEPVEFTPLPEESVSDLLAELEASEPLSTSFPSPRACIKNDGFSHDAGFFSVPQLGRVDSFSSSRNFPVPSPPAVASEPLGSCYFSNPHNTQKMTPQANSASASHGYWNGYQEHGQVSWVGTAERNPETWEKQHQQQTNPYYGGNRNSNARDQFFEGLNLDLRSWDSQ